MSNPTTREFRVLGLFDRHAILTAGEIAALLGYSYDTAYTLAGVLLGTGELRRVDGDLDLEQLARTVKGTETLARQ